MENRTKKISLENLSELDDRELLKVCLNDEYANNLCRDEDFWRERAINKFGRSASFYKPEEKTWRNYYLKILTDISDFEAWNFFDYISSWEIEDEPDNESIEVFDYERKQFKWDETFENRFHFLNLGNKISLNLKLNYWGDIILKEKITSKFYISPKDLLERIYYFYQEPIEMEYFQQLLQEGNPFAEKFSIKDVQKGKVKNIDMFGKLRFAKFEKVKDGQYNLIIDDDFYTKQTEAVIEFSDRFPPFSQ